MPVLVIGPQRTGTSLVAGILQRLGVDMLVNPISPNIKYCESEEWTRICQSICGDWHKPQCHHIEKSDIDEIHALVERHKGELWGAKSPYFPFIGHMLVKLIPSLRVIRTTRNIDCTVKSLIKRDKDIQFGVAEHIQREAFASAYVTDMACKIEKIPTGYIKYDAILENPEKIISAISNFVMPEKIDIAKAVEFVDPSMRNFKED